jgi:hypothetical protein
VEATPQILGMIDTVKHLLKLKKFRYYTERLGLKDMNLHNLKPQKDRLKSQNVLVEDKAP